MAEPAKKSARGGRRAGAGRKPKGARSPTSISELDLKSALAEPAPADIETVAQRHAHSALDQLVKLIAYGTSDPARISAAISILDRGYGKPAVGAPGEAFLPFLGNAPSRRAPQEIRDEARKYAHLAITVLNKIAESSESEMARAAAARALLDRGLGSVATAKLPADHGRQQLGKKEQASVTAREIGTGRYATPAPPKTALQ